MVNMTCRTLTDRSMVNRRALNRKAVSLIPSAADMTQVKYDMPYPYG